MVSWEKNVVVIYFGGEVREVDAYALSKALKALSDATRQISSQTNLGFDLQLFVEDIGHGSFKIKLRGKDIPIDGALKWGTHQIFLPLLVTFFGIKYMSPDPVKIEISENQVIIDTGDGRSIVVPREAYEAVNNIPNPKVIHKHVNEALDAIEEETSIDSFGLALNMDDEPILKLPRAKWGRIREKLYLEEEVTGTRVQIETVDLSILKPVFSNKSRKWDFVWRGIKISALIGDLDFIKNVMRRSYVIGNGDVLHCVLEISQEWQEEDRVWMNKKYDIPEVLKFVTAEEDPTLI